MIKRIVVTGLKARGYVDGRYVGEDKKAHANALTCWGRRSGAARPAPVRVPAWAADAARNAASVPAACRQTIWAMPPPVSAASAARHRDAARPSVDRPLAPASAIPSASRQPVAAVAASRAASLARIKSGRKTPSLGRRPRTPSPSRRPVNVLATKPNPASLPRRWGAGQRQA